MEVEKAEDPAAAAEAATRAGTRRTRDGFSFFDPPEVSSCLGSVGGFMFGFGEECSLRSWRERRRLQPQRREVCDYCLWLRRNIFALLLLGLAGVVTWESSVQALRINMNRTIVFPLYLPAAFALSLSCVWKASIVPGNLAGLYISRLYMLWRGHARFDTWAIVFLFLASVLESLEAQTCGYYMRKFLCKRGSNKSVPSIDTVRDALWYILLVVGCTLLFDFMIALCITVTPLVPWSSFWRFWATWWLGVLAAMMSISPAVTHLMAWECQPSLKKPLKITEWLLLLLINIGLLVVIFVIRIHTFIRPLPYIFFPLIMYMGFRCNRLGWALTVSSITYMCSWASIRGRGSLYITLGRPSPASSHLILEVELFNAVIGIVGITLAAAVREKQQLTKELHQMNIDLEHTVDERTTELRKAHEEAQMSQRKAEQASHAKSDFLANMSHEIRTPIHGILGLTALLLESELSDEQKESLMSVKECADLLLHIINSVLDLAKIESGRLEVERVPFNIEKMVSSTLRMLQARAQERGLQLLWEVDRQVPQVLVGDVGKIQQCLLNLVGNALKFTHEGSVTIRVTVMDQQEISSLSSNKSELLTESLLIKFEVRDTGIGISKEKLKDMFKPFTQADASTSRLYGGTGLGLCIVQRFVELLGGKICAESEANKGSTFYFCLPLLLTTSKDSPGEISPRAPNQEFDMSGKILDQIGNISTKGRGYKDRKLNILLAEDNEINQKVASRQLEKHGHSVMIVSDGQQALDVVRSQHNTLDLVLMDVQMPIMDGLLATQLIRQEEMERGWSRIPILGLTAHAIDGYQDKCFSHGMDSYLGKPFDIRQLLTTIGHILPPKG
ncbi:unnamed protein product [Sphagnum troendelagicum]|uniref:Histidine kinase n=1 Tax=Sphagnum troendelagicum TaxID=128251 RepID=A0ABP0UAI0_9BRYO